MSNNSNNEIRERSQNLGARIVINHDDGTTTVINGWKFWSIVGGVAVTTGVGVYTIVKSIIGLFKSDS